MAGDAVVEIKARLDIVEVIGGYVALQRSGRSHRALCPFHGERTPSFQVTQERQAWYCFGCREGGDVFSFVMRIERVDFRQALEMLAERAGVDLEPAGAQRRGGGAGRQRRRALELHGRAQAYFEHVLWATPTGEPGRHLLAGRGVSEELARAFGVGFAPAGGGSGDALVRYLTHRAAAAPTEVVEAGLAHRRGSGTRDRFRDRLVFPIRDERGRTLAFGGRALGEDPPKYLNSPETAIYHKSTTLFGLDLARSEIPKAGFALVVEGYFDVVAAHRAGVAGVVASSGTALSREQVRLLARHTTSLVLCFDADSAGRAAESRAVDIIAAEGLSARICILPPGTKDPDELVRGDPGALAAAVAGAPPEWEVLLDRAVGDEDTGSVDDRRRAAVRAVGVLARIPSAATRELYVERIGRRLEIGGGALTADVEVARRDPARRPPRLAVATTAIPPRSDRDDEGLADAAGGDDLPAWESYIGSLAVLRPASASRLVGEFGLQPELIVNPHVRRFLDLALAEPDLGDLPLHRLTAAEQRLAARLLMRPPPELDPGADPAGLDRAIGDCVRLLHEAAAVAEFTSLQREVRRARDDGREDDVPALLARLTAVQGSLGRLGRSRRLTSL